MTHAIDIIKDPWRSGDLDCSISFKHAFVYHRPVKIKKSYHFVPKEFIPSVKMMDEIAEAYWDRPKQDRDTQKKRFEQTYKQIKIAMRRAKRNYSIM